MTELTSPLQLSSNTVWRRDPRWLVFVGVGFITALRILALAISDADLFVDEAQYWLWGQELDWGYYSKPPLIGWLIRAVTDLAASDAEFWVRLPGPILHGVTALLLMGAAQEVLPRAQAAVVALTYVTLPLVAVGSVLISTDSVLLPFWAAALWLWLRQVPQPSAALALLMGLCLGLGMMSKYAALYFFVCGALVWICLPQARLKLSHLLIAFAGFGVAIAPNVIWNITHDLQTLHHTADNVDWVQPGKSPELNFDKLLEFSLAQLAVMGPVLFLAYLAAVVQGFWRGGPLARWLIGFSLPVLAIVCVQALLSKAFANWAAMTYPAGVVLVVLYLWDQARWILWAGIAVNLALCLAVGVAATQVTRWERGGGLLLDRYTGRAVMAEAVEKTAHDNGLSTIVASSRHVLADLYYYGRDSGLQVYAAPYKGPTPHYYAQKHKLPMGLSGDVLFIAHADHAPCDEARLIHFLPPQDGAYNDQNLAFFVLPSRCLEDRK
ncbi:putative membrane protein [Tritonibacter multivorans]|uniref:Putative membrane protein n=1 Tax=Tritonibacter multivorans TaxID=928856 RepID=A0A0P1GJI4_9RHOB|nr:glycosyltransferase family 39 protein [Tritonibacter multivorans]MDA7419516.1 glycosyltransferase family 39 protein [Tritonibacter multivorans]CUH75618.1 putative membrane protein [Tritonibacter multivorans]SFC64164.1 Dolichyl-phosphate-mannose-protein mannosyltransferase [Tritonibacter multivorans]